MIFDSKISRVMGLCLDLDEWLGFNQVTGPKQDLNIFFSPWAGEV